MKRSARLLVFVSFMAVASSPAELSQEYKVEELLATADARIHQYRQADATITVIDITGKPVVNADVSVEQLRHSFLFGCNIFQLFTKMNSSASGLGTVGTR